jgi:hypothetical protein
MIPDELPPEVYGCLSVAQNHLNASKAARYYYRGEDRKRKHLEKVQRLVSKAAKLLDKRRQAP